MDFDVYFWIMCAAGLLCAAAGVFFFLRKEAPNDITLLGAGAVLAATIVYAAASIIRPLAGDHARGNVPEFWAYMITQLSIPVAAAWWALVERTRWSNLILAAAGLVGIVMAARMNQIWYAAGGMAP